MSKIKGNLHGLTPLKGTELCMISLPFPVFLQRRKHFLVNLDVSEFTQEPHCSVTLEEGRT